MKSESDPREFTRELKQNYWQILSLGGGELGDHCSGRCAAAGQRGKQLQLLQPMPCKWRPDSDRELSPPFCQQLAHSPAKFKDSRQIVSVISVISVGRQQLCPIGINAIPGAQSKACAQQPSVLQTCASSLDRLIGLGQFAQQTAAARSQSSYRCFFHLLLRCQRALHSNGIPASECYVLKLSPQPQTDLALGLEKTNCADSSSSFQSIVVPTTFSRAEGSINSRTPLSSTISSRDAFSVA